jgi:NAD(P)-dependent dehydrogenase (short-subunit alcohol dehydrogenase family)
MVTLKDKVVVITGANGGMGIEVCKLLAEAGVKFALCSNDAPGLAILAENLRSQGMDVLAESFDICNESRVQSFMEQSVQAYGRLDYLLNLAGLSVPGKIWDTPEEDYDLNMDVNVKGTFLASKHFTARVDPAAGALIINIGSMASKNPNGNAPLYCAAKAAVSMLSRAMAIQTKERKVRITTLNPGGVNTGFWGDRPVAREKLMIPSDVAEVMLFVMTRDPRVLMTDIAFESFINF